MPIISLLLVAIALATLSGTFPGGRALYASPPFLALLALLALFLVVAVVQRARSLSAARRPFGAWGPVGVHAGLLIVLFSGLITFVFADVKEVFVAEGGTLPLPREKAVLRLDKFLIHLYPGKEEVRQYESRFTLLPDRGPRRAANLGVNQPLKIGRTKIFQMRYRLDVPRVEVVLHENGVPVEAALIEKGAGAAFGKAGLTVRYLETVPDFRIKQGGEVFSKSGLFANPAARLVVIRPDGTEETRWAFPGMIGRHREDDRWALSVRKFHKVYSSGVRVSNNPGVPVAYAGFALLVASAFLSSFALPREEAR